MTNEKTTLQTKNVSEKVADNTFVSPNFGRGASVASNSTKRARELETDADEEVMVKRRRSTNVVVFGDNEE